MLVAGGQVLLSQACMKVNRKWEVEMHEHGADSLRGVTEEWLLDRFVRVWASLAGLFGP